MRVIVEADGGSRGNPGPAAYGALVRDAATGEVLAQTGRTIGIATNNVAEYQGLIAGLELADEVAPDAQIEVRMDSKLVIEQMAGRWKIKHPDMRPLAIRAQSLAPLGTEWVWVPREQNAAADALLNLALDGKPVPSRPTVAAPAAAPEPSSIQQALRRWGLESPESPESPTRVLLVRHGATADTAEKRFSDAPDRDLELNETGLAQARAVATFLGRIGGIDAVLSSPRRRARQTADIIAATLGRDVTVADGWHEIDFGDWAGHTFAEVQEKWPDVLAAWLASPSVAPPGGESLAACQRRVRGARDAVLAAYGGRTVAVVTHVTPIKIIVRNVLKAAQEAVFRMELRPGSVTEVQWYADGLASLRSFNVEPSLL